MPVSFTNTPYYLIGGMKKTNKRERQDGGEIFEEGKLPISFEGCVCVTGHQSVECVQIMEWWSSNLGQWPLPNLVSVAYYYVFILFLPRPPFPSSDVLPGGEAPTSCPNKPSTNVRIISTQYHPPTWESTVSVPAYHLKCTVCSIIFFFVIHKMNEIYSLFYHTIMEPNNLTDLDR